MTTTSVSYTEELTVPRTARARFEGWSQAVTPAHRLPEISHHRPVEPVAELIPERVRAVPAVTDLELRGSRARGDAGPFSDWDFVVWTSDFAATRAGLAKVRDDLDALAALWDGLSDVPCYMLILDGPVKVDLIFEGVKNDPEPPWEVTASTLAAIDAHFWDWTLWLTSKLDSGKRELVRSELVKMHDHLLAPLGVDPVDSLEKAVQEYRRARSQWERSLDVHVDERLGNAVSSVVDRLRPPR